jgi:ubiquinone/menaquinone biosynthesis C-methylase UbiE
LRGIEIRYLLSLPYYNLSVNNIVDSSRNLLRLYHSPYFTTIKFIEILMKSSRLINCSVERFYNTANEENRLKQGLGPLEFERNQELILRYLSKKKATLIDIGGGPGHYAQWLAGLGHNVHLVDPVQKHIASARIKSSKQNFFHCHLGEAQNLHLQNEIADLVILHGPLYHLQEQSQRIKTLDEARRVLKPGGILLGFAINFTATTLASMLSGMLHEPEMFSMCIEELTSGLHNPPQNWPGLLPEAYFHKPGELQLEVEEAGFTFLDMIGVETCVWLEKDYFKSRGNAYRWSNLKRLISITEKEPSLLGLSPHMMVVARK